MANYGAPIQPPPHRSVERYVNQFNKTGSYFVARNLRNEWEKGGSYQTWIEDADKCSGIFHMCSALVRGDGKILSPVKCSVTDDPPMSTYRANVFKSYVYPGAKDFDNFLEGITLDGYMY